ncbi:hypothetical protein V2G26_020343 [Clonostachys chloroleuca]
MSAGGGGEHWKLAWVCCPTLEPKKKKITSQSCTTLQYIYSTYTYGLGHLHSGLPNDVVMPVLGPRKPSPATHSTSTSACTPEGISRAFFFSPPDAGRLRLGSD